MGDALEIGDLKFIDEEMLARKLRVSRKTLQRLRKNGEAPAHVELARSYYYNEKDVEQWLNDRTTK